MIKYEKIINIIVILIIVYSIILIAAKNAFVVRFLCI